MAFSTAGENGSIDFFPSIAFCFNGLEPPIAAPPDPLLGFPLFGFPSFGPGDGFVGFMPDPPNPKNPFPSFADWTSLFSFSSQAFPAIFFIDFKGVPAIDPAKPPTAAAAPVAAFVTTLSLNGLIDWPFGTIDNPPTPVIRSM